MRRSKVRWRKESIGLCTLDNSVNCSTKKVGRTLEMRLAFPRGKI